MRGGQERPRVGQVLRRQERKNLLREISIEDVRGRLIVVPVLNPAAFRTGTRASDAVPGWAKGDTTNGFPGDYRITYIHPDGTVSAELDLRIEKRGEVYDLSYVKDGKLLLVGVGLETQDGLAGGYRMVA